MTPRLRKFIGLFAILTFLATYIAVVSTVADYLPEHADIARELGFDAAVSTAWGAADTRTDLFQIPRFTPWDRTRGRFGLRLLRNLATQSH